MLLHILSAQCNNIHDIKKKATSDIRKQSNVSTASLCPSSSTLYHYSHSHGRL